MPTKEQHIDQANHNYQFWNGLNLVSTPYLDWIVCAIFYEATHWVEAFLAMKGQHSDRHATRMASMQGYGSDLGPILNDFRFLKNDSENARYRCYRHSLSDVQTKIIPHLNAIKQNIKERL